MGQSRLGAHARTRGVGKHRFKAAALVVAVASGLLALAAPQASAAAAIQDGPRNYIGVGPCPADATDCVVTAAAIDVDQTADGSAAGGGYNIVDGGTAAIKAVQNATNGATNTAKVSATNGRIASNAATFTSAHNIEVHQNGPSNLLDLNLVSELIRTEPVNVGGTIAQTSKDIVVCSQSGGDSVANLNVNQTQSASSSVGVLQQVLHTQLTKIDIRCDVSGNSGSFNANLVRDQNESAAGATPRLRQDNVSTVGAESGFGLGYVRLDMNTVGDASATIDGMDKKDEAVNSLLGAYDIVQGNGADGGWKLETDLTSASGVATLDVGSLANHDGFIFDWDQVRNGGSGTSVQDDSGGILGLPPIFSPCSVTANIESNLTGPPGTAQTGRQFVRDLHTKDDCPGWNADLSSNLNDQDSPPITNHTHITGQTPNVSVKTCNNVNGCPNTTETNEPVTHAHMAVRNDTAGDAAFVGHDGRTNATAAPNDVVEYQMELHNEGETDSVAQGATLTSSVPANTTYVGASEGCSEASGVVTCNLPDIAGGQSAASTFKVQVDADAQPTDDFSNSATGDQDGAGPDAAVQSNSTTVDVVAGPPPVTEVELLISGTDKKTGQIPVSVLSDADFDATTIDVPTVCFGDAEDPSQRDCTLGNKGSSNTDVDGDGDLDKKLHYDSSQAGIDPTDTQACATGRTVNGEEFAGCGALPRR